MIEVIPPSVVKALDALATYEYMTSEHMVAAGVVSHPGDFLKRIRDRLHRTRKPLIERKPINMIDKRFRVHDVYCLTRHGADYAAEVLERNRDEILFPKGLVQFQSHDYFHRMGWIHTHIALRNWAAKSGNDVKFVRSYHTKIGAQRGKGALRSKAITRIEFGRDVLGGSFLEPDGIAYFSDGDKQRLCAVEVHRATDTKRIVRQLERHMHAISLGTLSREFSHDYANFVLSIHERETTFNHVRQRILQLPDFAAFSPLFLFNTLNQVKADFSQGWVFANGTNADFFISR